MADYNSKHEKVAAKLRDEITGTEYEPGDQLPSENRLCDYFKVSRVTVRHALATLENEGLIYRKQGVGAFVNDRELKSSLVRLTDFSEDMRQAGLQSSSRLISLDRVDPIPEVNEVLQLRPDMKLIRIKRVRLANENPVAYDVTWLPPGYGQLLFDEDLTTQTIYDVFEDKYDIQIQGGSYRITAKNVDETIAEHLNMEPGSAVLEIDRCSRTTADKKVYFQKRYYNPAHVSYVMELYRNEDESGSYKDGLPLKEFSPVFAK